MKIAIGNDHAGLELKNTILNYLKTTDHKIINCGTNSTASVDYPIFGYKCATLVATKQADLGILICGTGIGIGNSANKVKNIRCAVVNSAFSTEKAVKYSNANIIALGSRVIGNGLAVAIVKTFLNTKYSFNKCNDCLVTDIDKLISSSNYDLDLNNK